jgi:hypothetical protein
MTRLRRDATTRLLALLATLACTAACGSTVRLQTSGTGAGTGLQAAPVDGGQPSAAVTGDGTSVPVDTGSSTAGSSANVAGAPGAGATSTLPAGAAPTAAGRTSARASTAAKGTRTPTARKSSAATTGPIPIGFLLTGTSNADQFGVSLGNTVQEKDVDDALVRAINKQGGLAGRKVQPIYAKTDTGSSNWDDDFNAACSTFTQDNHVVAVLGYEFTHVGGFESCLTKAGIPHLNTGFNIADQVELSQYPLYRSMAVPTIERRQMAKTDGALATGVLTKDSKLGVVLDGCPGTQRSFDDVTLPYLKSRGIIPAKVLGAGCPNGANASASDAVAGVPNILLQFRQAQVDVVMFAAGAEAGPLLIFATAAESQSYRPTWLVSSLAQPAVLQAQNAMPRSQLANVKVFGWMPTQDVSPSQYPAANANQKRCLALLKSENITPTAPVDFYYAFQTCDPLFLYERALQSTGGNVDGKAVVAAVDGVGTSFTSTIGLDGGSVFTLERRNNAATRVRPLVFASDCSCFVYQGATRAMP